MAKIESTTIDGRKVKVGSRRYAELTGASTYKDAAGNVQKLTPKELPKTTAGTVKPITPADLTESQTPATVPPIQPSTADTGMLAEIQAGTDQFQQQAETKAAQALQDKQQSQQDFLSSILEAPTQSELESQAYREEVDPLQKELDSINNQIRQKQASLARQIEKIQTQPGLTARQADARVAEVERQSLREQADLYIIQEGIQGRYDSAVDIAQRSVAAQMERQTKIQNVLGMMYQDNKELFNTAEQRAFAVKQSNWERQKQNEADRLEQINNLSIDALQNGAPTSVVTAMRSAKDINDAIGIGGAYIGLLARQSAARTAASANLQRRKQLYELAAMGDQEAIDELGFDPTDQPLSAKEIMKNEEEYTRLSDDVTRINGLLSNDIGLQTSSGALRTPFVTSIFNVKGGVASYPFLKTQKEDFLTGASFVIDNLTFDKLLKLKAEGATFGALSDNELRTIGNAAGELSAMAIKDNGQLKGFRGSEDKLREQLQVVQDGLKKAQDQLNADLLSKSEQEEIVKLGQ